MAGIRVTKWLPTLIYSLWMNIKSMGLARVNEVVSLRRSLDI